jgi:hypothetical protein
MNEAPDPALEDYPHGRGYGHDYMRGGEVLGGYGYAEREEYEKRRGDREDAAAGTQEDKPENVRHQAH